MIYVTLEFETGRHLIAKTYDITLRYLVKNLITSQLLLDNINNNNNNNNHNIRVTLDQVITNIHYVTKTIMALLTRSKDTEKKLGNVFHYDTTKDDQYMDVLRQLINGLFNIITEPNVYEKDCSQVASLALGAIMNLPKDVDFVKDWILGWFFLSDVTDQMILPKAATHMSNILNIIPRTLFTGKKLWEGKEPIMLFIIRGMLSTIRRDALLCPIDMELETLASLSLFNNDYDNNDNAHYSNLFELFFNGTKYLCMTTNGDSLSKVIAFDSMATWLLELKNMMQNTNDDIAYASSKLLTQDNVDKLIQHIWNYWDDPLDALQHKVRSVFELLLVILDMRAAHYNQVNEYESFLLDLLKKLLQMDWHRKVKYALMNLLIVKIGTDTYFELEPDLIWKSLRSMDSLSLSSQVASFVLELLNQRILEKIPDSKPSKGQHIKLIAKDNASKTFISSWISLWELPMLKCLMSPSDILRQNASGFLLQTLFKIHPDSFWYLIDILNNTTRKEWDYLDNQYRLHAFISTLKVARSLDIVDGGIYSLDCDSPKYTRKVSVDTLKLALYHLDPQVRIDAFGVLCESRKGAAVVMNIELELIKYFIPLNMNCNSAEFRQKLCAHLTKLLTRLHGNIYAQHRIYQSHMTYVKKAKEANKSIEDINIALKEAENAHQTIQSGKIFLYWLNDHIATSLYPGSSFQRVATALRILNILVKVFGIHDSTTILSSSDHFPFTIPLASPRNTKLLIDTLMDSYDFNRNMAFDNLIQFPNPLPGIVTIDHVQELLWWGLNNVVSTRAGESDSGAMVFRLIFTKYVVGLGFDLYPQQISNSKKELVENQENKQESSAVIFTHRLLDMLEEQINIAKSNLLLAAQQHPMHGTLLALQYVFREINYSDKQITDDYSGWKEVHSRALTLIKSVCDSVMDVLSNPSPEGNVPSSFKEMEEAIDELVGDDDEENGDEFGPKHQVILSCCWRAVKEASSLMEVIISKTPLQSTNNKNNKGILTYDDLGKCGNLLRSLLTSIRHRGAFSSVYPTYVALCSRLLNSQDITLHKLPQQWLQGHLSSLTSSNISITRRSAGLPLCILAIVSSESVTKKELLGETFQHLLKLAREEPPMDADQRVDLPQVHAYNIMRTIFMDSKLGTRVLEYASDGYFLAINGFSSSSWAIRNCSVMLFSTLLQRTLGTKKIRDEHSTVNNLTGQEFFTRFPKLHSYLLKELKIAVDQLLGNSTTEVVHPGLYPILTLLSRLRPSVVDSKVLPMSSFAPLVMSCAASSIYKTREMSARALIPLIPSTSLTKTVIQLLTWDAKLSQNEIHGRLLQVQLLLRGHLLYATKKDTLLEFISESPSAFLQCFKVMNRLHGISVALFFNIIAEFFFECGWIFEDNSSELINEFLILSDKSFEILRSASISYCGKSILVKSDENLIGKYLERQSMANIITLGYLNLDVGDLVDYLYLLDDHDYEVRLSFMTKLMKKFNTIDTKEIYSIDKLQADLIQKTYDGEDNIHCFAAAAKLLICLKNVQPYPENCHDKFTLEQYWDKLLEHFYGKKSILVTESVLPLLGSLLAQIIKSPLRKEWIQTCLITWSSFIIGYSNKEVTLPLREAAVKSIEFIAEKLLMNGSSLGKEGNEARIIVEMAIIQLLQDDDIDIRHNMAKIVSEALALKSPVHPERAVELVHSHLASSPKYNPSLHTSLSQLLIGSDNLGLIWKNEMSKHKALFEKENPNIYKEELVDVQWHTIDLDQLHYRHPDEFSKTLAKLTKETMDVIQQLIDFLKSIGSTSETLSMKEGPFGITSKPKVFLAAYRLLLSTSFTFGHLTKFLDPATNYNILAEELYASVLTINEESIHPLLWDIIQGESGLKAKLYRFLCQFQPPTYANMFLVSPDIKQ
ncbi:unnamed protein product [Cunninghamella echinulata]